MPMKMIEQTTADAGRQHVPRAGVLGGERGVGGGGDAAGQRARQPFGEVAWRVAGQMAEQVAPDVAGHRHKRIGRRPAGDAPQQVVGGDQRAQRMAKAYQSADCFLRSGRNNIDQVLETVLDRDGADHRHQHRKEDRKVPPGMAAHIAPQEPDRVRLQTRKIRRAVVPHFSRNRCHFTRPVAQFRRGTRRFFATFPSYNEKVISAAPEQVKCQ